MAWQLLDRQVFVKVYEVQFFKTIFHPIHEYVFGFSFLATLNIYKNYFKGRKRLRTIAQKQIAQVWRRM